MIARPTRRGTALVAALVVALLAVPTLVVGQTKALRLAPDGQPFTVLLLGSDDGPPRDANPLTSRADAIHILTVAGDRQSAVFVSLPRDSWIPVTGSGTTKINACLTRGPENCVSTVESEFGISIDGYIITSMWGFAEAVNAFVGCPEGPDTPCDKGLVVDITDPCDSNCGGIPILATGEQALTGYQALTNARHRKTRPGGDFARSQAQAEMLSIAHAEVHRSGGLVRTMEALRILRRHSVTDIDPTTLVRLALESLSVAPENVEREFAPSRGGTVGDASVVFLEPGAYTLITDAADGRLGG